MIGTTLRTITSLNRDLRTLLVVTLLFRAGLMAFPFLPAYLLLQGVYRPVDVGVIVGAFGVGALLADVSASIFLGRISARAVMTVGLLLHAVVLTAVPFIGGVAVLVAATLVWGFTYEVYTPAVYSQTIERSAPDERKVAFSCNRLAVNLGMGIGPVIGGLVFAVRPVSLFFINALCVLAAVAYLLARTGRGSMDRAKPEEPRPRRRMIAPTLRGETQFWTIFCLAVPIHLAYALPSVLVSVYIITGLGLPSYWVSLVFFVNALIIVLFEVPLNRAMRSVSHSCSLLVGYAFAGVGFAAMGISSSGVMMLCATAVWTIGEMIVFPGFLSYVSDLSDQTVTDRNVSLYSAGPSLGIIVAPSTSLALITWGNPATPWLLIGAAVFVTFFLLLSARISTYTWYSGENSSGELGREAPGSQEIELSRKKLASPDRELATAARCRGSMQAPTKRRMTP